MPDGTNLYGKTAKELQSDIVIGESEITGTLHHVTEYTDFNPSNVTEQSGNYLALDIKADEGATVKFELVGGDKGPITLSPDDMQVVSRIKDKSQSIKITASKDDQEKVTTYSLSGLTLESGSPAMVSNLEGKSKWPNSMEK